MPGNNKKKLVEDLLQYTADELEFMSYSDSEVDDILDDLDDNLEIISSFRYSFQRRVPKSNWFESTLPNLTKESFKAKLCVTKEQFNLILKLIKDHEVYKGRNSSRQFSLAFQLSLVLYRLGSNGEDSSLGKIASLFGVGNGGTIDKVTDRVFESLLALEEFFIQWPSEQEKEKIIINTYDELPDCVGYIGSTEIRLFEAPIHDKIKYSSKGNVYSIKLQAICDYNCRIRHITTGYPGSLNDTKIFTDSEIGKNPKKFVSGEQWIAGGISQRLTTHVLTPFEKKENFNTQKQLFNRTLNKYRVRIEHCFGFLKEKFKSLKELKVRISNEESHMFATKWIRVCCILYNIILPYLDDNELDFFVSTFHITNENELTETENEDMDKDAIKKRKDLIQILLQ